MAFFMVQVTGQSGFARSPFSIGTYGRQRHPAKKGAILKQAALGRQLNAGLGSA